MSNIILKAECKTSANEAGSVKLVLRYLQASFTERTEHFDLFIKRILFSREPRTAIWLQ